MNSLLEHQPVPDTRSVESELIMCNAWDSAGIAHLIRSKCSHGETPAFLFLGKCEAHLLCRHFEQAFGPEAVITLKGNYYMGLEIIEIDCPSFVFAGGRKLSNTLENRVTRQPCWRDAASAYIWQFSL